MRAFPFPFLLPLLLTTRALAGPLGSLPQFDDVSTSVAAENDYAPWRITAQRAGHVNLRNVAGTEIGTASNPVRIDPTGTTTQPVSQGTPAAASGAWPVKLTDGTNVVDTVITPDDGKKRIATQALIADLSGTGSITTTCATPTAACPANSTVELALESTGSVQVQIAGTFSGATMQVDGTVDGTSWVTLFNATGSGGTYATTAFSNAGKYRIYRTAGLQKVRVRASALASGTVNVTIVGTLPVNWTESLMSGQYTASLPTLTDGGYGPVQLDVNGRLMISGNIAISTLPAFSFKSQNAINPGVTTYSTYAATGSVAIRQFFAGGTGVGRQTLSLYTPSTTSFVTGGDFEVAGDCGTSWVWSSVAGAGSIAQSAVQANTGTKSCALTFTNSSGNNAQVVGETVSLNVTTYRYLNASFFNVVSAGGAYTRTISIILTDTSGNTRTYSLSGSSTAGAFSTSAWIPLQAEIENPTSSVGTFDPSAVASVKLQMADSANKAGTVYWDTVRFSNLLTPLFPIYHGANVSFNVIADPVVVLSNGDQIIVGQQNNDTVRKEFFSLVGGVSL